MPKTFVDNGRRASEEELVRITQWFRAAIPTLREMNKNAGFESLGVHIRYGVGLGKQFNQSFNGLSINKVVKQLAEQKLVVSTMGKGGPSYFLWEDRPESYRNEPIDSDVIAAAIKKKLVLIEADDMLRMNRESPNAELPPTEQTDTTE